MAKGLSVPATAFAALLLAAFAGAPALLAQESPVPGMSGIEATGYLSPVYPRDAYSHLLNDEATGATYFARSETVDLDSYDDGQRVSVTGTLAGSEGAAESILEVTRVEPAEDSLPDETATLTFELAVEGEPPAEATFFGAMRGEGTRYVPLADPDGDETYTGNATVSRFPPGTRPLPPDAQPVSLPVWILQGTGTQAPGEGEPPGPGEPTRVIEDFGPMRVEDRTLSASISFVEDGGADTTPDEGFTGGTAAGIRSILPGTGGSVVLALIGAGALLIGGLLACRVFR